MQFDIRVSYLIVCMSCKAAIFGDKMFDKLFSRHMKMERMLIICVSLISLLMCVLIYDVIVINQRSRIKLSDEPIVSGSATTTATQKQFDIKGVYTSKDKTQAMIVISGDLSAISYAADTYQVYLLGPSATEFAGGLYVFGDLDLLCVYVTDKNTFKTEVTQLVLKSTASTEATTKTTTDDMEFSVNLGAAHAITASFMSDSGLDVELMANSAFSHDDDAAIREELKSLQSDMVSARVSLSNVRENLDKVGLQLPAFPEWMSDDKVATRENTGSEYVATSCVFAGAADFDWENITRLNDYAQAANISINDINPDASRPKIDDDIPTEWYKKDNSIVTEPTPSEQALMTQYTDAITAYYTAKIAYQDKVAELITTQAKYQENIQNYTSNVGKDAIVGVKQKK